MIPSDCILFEHDFKKNNNKKQQKTVYTGSGVSIASENMINIKELTIGMNTSLGVNGVKEDSSIIENNFPLLSASDGKNNWDWNLTHLNIIFDNFDPHEYRSGIIKLDPLINSKIIQTGVLGQLKHLFINLQLASDSYSWNSMEEEMSEMVSSARKTLETDYKPYINGKSSNGISKSTITDNIFDLTVTENKNIQDKKNKKKNKKNKDKDIEREEEEVERCITSKLCIESLGCQLIDCENVGELSKQDGECVNQLNLFLLNFYAFQLKSLHFFGSKLPMPLNRDKMDDLKINNGYESVSVRCMFGKDNNNLFVLNNWYFICSGAFLRFGEKTGKHIIKASKKLWFPSNLREICIHDYTGNIYSKLIGNILSHSNGGNINNFNRIDINGITYKELIDLFNSRFDLLIELINSDKLNCIIVKHIELDMSHLINDYFYKIMSQDDSHVERESSSSPQIGYYGSHDPVTIDENHLRIGRQNYQDYGMFPLALLFSKLSKKVNCKCANGNGNGNGDRNGKVDKLFIKLGFKISLNPFGGRDVSNMSNVGNSIKIGSFFECKSNSFNQFMLQLIKISLKICEKIDKLMIVLEFDFVGSYKLFKNSFVQYLECMKSVFDKQITILMNMKEKNKCTNNGEMDMIGRFEYGQWMKQTLVLLNDENNNGYDGYDDYGIRMVLQSRNNSQTYHGPKKFYYCPVCCCS